MEEAGPVPVADQAPPPLVRHKAARWGAGLLLLLVSGPLLCRACDVDGVTPMPQLLAFLPWLLAPAATALVLSAGTRWLAGCAWALTAVLGTLFFLPPYAAGRAPVTGPVVARLRILTANLEFGGATPALLEALRREKPDLVSVQECAPEECAPALEGAQVRAAFPYRVIVGGGRAQGSALLSRFPLRPDGAVPGTLAMPRALVRLPGAQLLFQVVHPMPPVAGGLELWRTELGRVRAMAAGRGSGPTVIAGDFNASQDHAAFRSVLDTGMRDSAAVVGRSRTPTWPSLTAPPLGAQIDHVLLSPALQPDRARFLDLPGTDHRALVVDATLHG